MMKPIQSLWVIAWAACLLACENQNPMETERKAPAIPLPFTQYAKMHSGYRDADGARMEAFLRCWKEQTLQWAQENGKQDAAAALAGRYQTQDALDALPPSAQNFWRAAGKVDWLPLYELKVEGAIRFWPPSHIKPFREHDAEWLEILTQSEWNAPDERYYQYNRTQDLAARSTDFYDLLVYGHEGKSFVYGEIHNEQSLDGERQFLTYGVHSFGKWFKSFAHMLAVFYLEEYQHAHGRDASLGHIYYFNGDWNQTCVPLLFDADEIASWQPGKAALRPIDARSEQ